MMLVKVMTVAVAALISFAGVTSSATWLTSYSSYKGNTVYDFPSHDCVDRVHSNVKAGSLLSDYEPTGSSLPPK